MLAQKGASHSSIIDSCVATRSRAKQIAIRLFSQTCSHKGHKVCERITYQCSVVTFVAFVRGSDFFISAFVLGADGREIEMAFLPRFFARFRLFAAGESQQTRGAVAKIDIVARSKSARLPQKSFLVRGVENQFPTEMFLSREHELNRFVMRADQQQECSVADRLAFEIHNISRVAAEQHSETTRERRGPFLFAHFVPAGIEPHHVANFGILVPPSVKKFRSPKNWMIFAKLNQSLR